MSRHTWVEVSCDYCHNVIDHVTPGDVSSKIRKAGGVVSKYGDFCDKECRYLQKGHINDTNGEES